jgi:hypothetical protein
MSSDEFDLQGYCAACKGLFKVRWLENLCRTVSTNNRGFDAPDEDETILVGVRSWKA